MYTLFEDRATCTFLPMAYPSKTDRQTILFTAMDLVEKDGIDTLAIRTVATALKLAPNALYRYFGGLADLKDALAEESRRILLAELKTAAGNLRDENAIRNIAKTYVNFARERPHVFSLTLLPSARDYLEDAAHLQSWRFVVDHVSDLYGEPRSQEAAVALWAFLHGITALEAASVIGGDKPASGFEFGLELWIRGAHADSQ